MVSIDKINFYSTCFIIMATNSSFELRSIYRVIHLVSVLPTDFYSGFNTLYSIATKRLMAKIQKEKGKSYRS